MIKISKNSYIFFNNTKLVIDGEENKINILVDIKNIKIISYKRGILLLHNKLKKVFVLTKDSWEVKKKEIIIKKNCNENYYVKKINHATKKVIFKQDGVYLDEIKLNEQQMKDIIHVGDRQKLVYIDSKNRIKFMNNINSSSRIEDKKRIYTNRKIFHKTNVTRISETTSGFVFLYSKKIFIIKNKDIIFEKKITCNDMRSLHDKRYDLQNNIIHGKILIFYHSSYKMFYVIPERKYYKIKKDAEIDESQTFEEILRQIKKENIKYKTKGEQ